MFNFKKGSAHLEIIISFTVFLSFTIFLLYYLAPVETVNLSDNVLQTFRSSFLDYVSVEVPTLFVKSNESGCVDVDVSDFDFSSGVVARTAYGVILDSKINSNIVSVNSADKGFYISSSDELNSGTYSCSSPKNYSLGDLRNEVFLSNKSLKELENNYTENYNALKSVLGLPSAVEFAIISDGYISAEKSVPASVESYSDEIRANVLYSNGTIRKEVFIIKIW